jgi:hypothetical protein
MKVDSKAGSAWRSSITSVMRGPVIHENMVVWCRRRMPKAGRKRGRGRGRWCRKECSGCACSVAAPGFVWGLFTRSKRGCRAQGDIGRMVSMGERERERKARKERSMGHCRQSAQARELSPQSCPWSRDGLFVSVCMHLQGWLTARGRHVRNAPGASQS